MKTIKSKLLIKSIKKAERDFVKGRTKSLKDLEEEIDQELAIKNFKKKQ